MSSLTASATHVIKSIVIITADEIMIYIHPIPSKNWQMLGIASAAAVVVLFYIIWGPSTDFRSKKKKLAKKGTFSISQINSSLIHFIR